MTIFKSSGLRSCIGEIGPVIPALLKTPSIVPALSKNSLNMSLTDLFIATSHFNIIPLPPESRTSLRHSSAAFKF